MPFVNISLLKGKSREHPHSRLRPLGLRQTTNPQEAP